MFTRFPVPHIKIDTSTNAQNVTPDTFDGDVILHEHGHWVGYYSDFLDESPGGTHYWYMSYTLELAATEAFAHFWSAMVRNDPIQRNWRDNFTVYYGVDIENGEHGWNGSMSGSANNYGTSCEAAVAGILWDICDTASDDYDSFGDSTFPRQPADLADGVFGILVALLDDDRKIDGHHPDNIEEFWDAWFTLPALGHPMATGDIWYEHGGSTHLGCCVGMRGNVDGDPNDEIDISDLVMLCDYMFSGGAAPPCWAEANIDGSCCGPDGVPDTQDDLDIGDLVMLCDYMFAGGVAPWPCP